jgi:import receptor subunit TOM70
VLPSNSLLLFKLRAMDGKSAPIPSQPIPIQLNTSVFSDAGSSSSLWDRIATWASEHKAVVYTITGVTLVVTAAGVVYYVNDSNKTKEPTSPSSKKSQSKKARRKVKKEVEDSPAKKDAEESHPGQSCNASNGFYGHD